MSSGAVARASQLQEVKAFRENVEARREAARAAREADAPKDPTDKRRLSEEARERLRAVVVDLFAEGLFHQVGMREIAKRAGVGLATIYKYFGAKEDMVVACLEPDLERLLQSLALASRCEVGAKRRTRAYLVAFVRFHLENPRLAEIVHLNTPAKLWAETEGGLMRDQRAVLAEILRHGAREKSVRGDISIDEIVDLVAGAMRQFILRVIEDGSNEVDPEVEGERLFAAVWPMVSA